MASRPSQSPKLENPRASHNRRNGVMARTARTSGSGSSSGPNPRAGPSTGGPSTGGPPRGGPAVGSCGALPMSFSVLAVADRSGRRARSLGRRLGRALGGRLGRLLRRGLGGLLRRTPAGGRSARPLLGEQLAGPLEGHRGRVIRLAERGVRLAVRDVG